MPLRTGLVVDRLVEQITKAWNGELELSRARKVALVEPLDEALVDESIEHRAQRVAHPQPAHEHARVEPAADIAATELGHVLLGVVRLARHEQQAGDVHREVAALGRERERLAAGRAGFVEDLPS